jgi:hypothetical protein
MMSTSTPSPENYKLTTADKLLVSGILVVMGLSFLINNMVLVESVLNPAQFAHFMTQNSAWFPPDVASMAKLLALATDLILVVMLSVCVPRWLGLGRKTASK